METTEIVRKDSRGEIVVRDPFNTEDFHGAANVTALVKSANDRVALRREQFDALTARTDAMPSECAELRRAIEKDDGILKAFDKDLRDALLAASGFLPYVVQTKGAGAKIDPLSVRGKFAAMVAQLKSREDAAKPSEKPEKRMLVIDATPSAWKKITDAITKAGVKVGFMSPLVSAKRIDAVGKVIKQIEEDEAQANAAMGGI